MKLKLSILVVEKGIGLKLFGWCGVRWYTEVMSAVDGLNIPSTICGLIVTWKVFSGYEESARFRYSTECLLLVGAKQQNKIRNKTKGILDKCIVGEPLL